MTCRNARIGVATGAGMNLRDALALAKTDTGTDGATEAVRASQSRLMASKEAHDAAALAGGFDTQTESDFAQAVRFEPMYPGAVANADLSAMFRAAFRPLRAARRRC